MRVEDWFALAVRVVGITLLIAGLGTLLDASLLKLGYFQYPDSSPAYYLIYGAGRGHCRLVSDPGRAFSCRVSIRGGR